MPIAIIALVRLGPRKAASAIARIRNGQASMASVMREISASIAAAEIAGEHADRHAEQQRDRDRDHAREQRGARAPDDARSTSRPISSVPNQCAALGALRIALQLVAIGSCGAIQRREAARARRRPARPPSAEHRAAPAQQAAPRARRCRRRLRSACSKRHHAAISPQPRIDHEVGQVGEQVEHDVGRRGDQHHALHHRVVAVEHRVDDQLAEAGDA